VTVAKEAVLAEPLRVDVHAEGGTAFAHIVFDIKPFAPGRHRARPHRQRRARGHRGPAGRRRRQGDLRLGAGPGSATRCTCPSQNALLGRDATYKSVNVTFGGDLVRLVPQVKYAAPGGDAELLGVYFADDGQHLEQRLFVDHAVPNCRSRVTYKGALQGADAQHRVGSATC